MRVLVTGAGGFVGRHLIRELLEHRHEIVAFDARPKPAAHPSVPWRTGDIRQAESVRDCVTDGRPDACIHLAAMTFIPAGWAEPDLIFSVNLLGTLHLLQAFKASAPKARILVISSAEVYGHSERPHPVTENDLFDPTNPYAVAKAAADQMSLLYHREYSLPILVARPCNHIG
ncbi:MAG: NAD-dependent epimerase/dehydratase family protein, partial [Lentisphaerae bacterium]|nr:NAD-dependent epimerase/dehydratase family protein [Lentisphaerota bacterium]